MKGMSAVTSPGGIQSMDRLSDRVARVSESLDAMTHAERARTLLRSLPEAPSQYIVVQTAVYSEWMVNERRRSGNAKGNRQREAIVCT